MIEYGRFQELKNEEAKKARDILFGRVFSLMTSSTIHAYGHEVTGKIDDGTQIIHVMYRIKIKTVTGRFEKQ